MFYAHYVLLKKGPLARVWLAAHWEKKLTKAQIYDTDIAKAVDYILEPRVRMALRTTGHLLLGVVKIYSRKTKYLLAECTETCTRMRLAFRPFAVVVDLPEDRVVAPLEAITYPEVFHDFDSAGMDISLNQSRYEDITMMEDVAMPTNAMYNPENEYGFGDEEEIEERRGGSSGFGIWGGVDNLRISNNERKLSGFDENLSGNRIDMGQILDEDGVAPVAAATGEEAVDQVEPMEGVEPSASPARDPAPDPNAVPASPFTPGNPPQQSDPHGMTTLLSNPADGYVLAPVDEYTPLGASRQRGVSRKRRRCLEIDHEKSIAPEAMKMRIREYGDTLRPLDLAPVTKRMMLIKERNSVGRMFSFPGLDIGSKLFSQVFQPNLKTREHPDEEDATDPGITLVEDPTEEPMEIDRNQEPIEQIDRQSVARPLLPPIPEETGETPSGKENEDPLPFFDQVMPFNSPLPVDMARGDQADDAAILMQRNSSTPVRPRTNSPRKTPQKDRSNRSKVQVAPEENDMDTSRTSRASVTWDIRARSIVTKLRELAVENVFASADASSRLKFADLIDPRDTGKSVARKFYAVLELTKSKAVNVEQAEPYTDIFISSGPSFYDNSL